MGESKIRSRNVSSTLELFGRVGRAVAEDAPLPADVSNGLTSGFAKDMALVLNDARAWTGTAYEMAMRSQDGFAKIGLSEIMNGLMTYGFSDSSMPDSGVCFAMKCDFSLPPSLDMGSFDDMDGVREWVAKKFDVDKSSVTARVDTAMIPSTEDGLRALLLGFFMVFDKSGKRLGDLPNVRTGSGVRSSVRKVVYVSVLGKHERLMPKLMSLGENALDLPNFDCSFVRQAAEAERLSGQMSVKGFLSIWEGFAFKRAVESERVIETLLSSSMPSDRLWFAFVDAPDDDVSLVVWVSENEPAEGARGTVLGTGSPHAMSSLMADVLNLISSLPRKISVMTGNGFVTRS